MISDSDNLQDRLAQAFWSGSRDQRHEAARGAVRAGAKIDAPLRSDGSTLLMRACALGHMESVHILLDLGADPMVRRADGACALWIACAEHPQHLEAVAALWARGADPKTSGPGGKDVAELLRALPEREPERALVERLAKSQALRSIAGPHR